LLNKKVKIFFPQKGPSFLPRDRDFELIKKKLKKVDRLYTSEDYVELILRSSNNSDKFLVFLVDNSIIFDYQNWFPYFYIKNTNAIECLTRKQSVKYHKIMYIPLF